MATYRDRLKKLFSDREFRLNQFIFLLVGAFLFSISFLIQNEFWADVVKDFAITFVAVALVQFIWNVLGGDPLELEIRTSTAALDQELTEGVDISPVGVDCVGGEARFNLKIRKELGDCLVHTQ